MESLPVGQLPLFGAQTPAQISRNNIHFYNKVYPLQYLKMFDAKMVS